MNNKIKKHIGGYTLVEIIFYIALLAILSFVIFNSLMVMTNVFKETRVYSDFVQSSSFFERIGREIRQAYGINAISGSDLILNTTDELGNNKTVRFQLSGADVVFYEDGVSMGNLNSPDISVTSLSFTQITMTSGLAIRVIMSVSSDRDLSGRVETFYTTVALRGDY